MGDTVMEKPPAAETVDYDFAKELSDLIPQLRRRAYFWAKSAHRAEDLMQDTLEKCLRHQHSFKPGTNLAAWAGFIMRNIWFSDRRSAWRLVEMGEGAAERIPLWPNQLWKLELDEVLIAMQFLTPEHQEVLELVAMEGRSYEEVAEQIGVAVGTIKSRVARAKNELERYFGIDHTGESRSYDD